VPGLFLLAAERHNRPCQSMFARKAASMDAPHRLVERIERMEGLDRYAKPLAAAVSRAVQPQVVRNALSGANLGHPLHPVLKDGPIGAWTMSLLLDAVGGPESAQAADLLVGAGIVTAVPAAAAGLNDWSDTTGEDTRVGLAHAAANMTALSLFTASFAARRAGHRGRGKALSLVGFGVLSVGGTFPGAAPSPATPPFGPPLAGRGGGALTPASA